MWELWVIIFLLLCVLGALARIQERMEKHNKERNQILKNIEALLNENNS